MNKYEVVYGDLINSKNLKKFSPQVLKKIKQSIDAKLTTQPELFGKPLRKSLRGFRRMRISDFRVIFKIEKKVVKIVFIGKKPDVYKHFLRKLKP